MHICLGCLNFCHTESVHGQASNLWRVFCQCPWAGCDNTVRELNILTPKVWEPECILRVSIFLQPARILVINKQGNAKFEERKIHSFKISPAGIRSLIHSSNLLLVAFFHLFKMWEIKRRIAQCKVSSHPSRHTGTCTYHPHPHSKYNDSWPRTSSNLPWYKWKQ